jgi:hypothetical protein
MSSPACRRQGVRSSEFKKYFFSELQTPDSELITFIGAPNGHRSRPSLPPSVPNSQAPNGNAALDVLPNGLGSKPNPHVYEPNARMSKQHLDRGVCRNTPPEVQVVSL